MDCLGPHGPYAVARRRSVNIFILLVDDQISFKFGGNIHLTKISRVFFSFF